MRPLKLFSLVTLVAATSVLVGLNAAQEPDLKPTGKGVGTLDHPPMPEQAQGQGPTGQATRTAKPTSNGISYHGGPVMTNGVKMYYIWYGNWSGNTATDILPFLAQSIGGSPYYNINTTYRNGSGLSVLNQVSYGGAIAVGYPYGNSLTDTQIKQVVLNAISGPTAQLPADVNALYFVLTSADVTASSGFCTSYCGWHTYTTLNNTAIKYSFVGNPDRCPSACEAQSAASPNGNPGADGMASIIAHELEEAATDPQLNAWYDTRGYENADKCAWTFGTTVTKADGAKYNMTFNYGGSSKDFLIQRNWVNASGGYCAVAY